MDPGSIELSYVSAKEHVIRLFRKGSGLVLNVNTIQKLNANEYFAEIISL